MLFLVATRSTDSRPRQDRVCVWTGSEPYHKKSFESMQCCSSEMFGGVLLRIGVPKSACTLSSFRYVLFRVAFLRWSKCKE